jgi:hypothetical protein
MNNMIPGLVGQKMSSSIPESKIGLLEEPAVVQQRLLGAVCIEGVVEGNTLLPILKEIVFPLASLRKACQTTTPAGEPTTEHSPPVDVSAGVTYGAALFWVPMKDATDGTL